jgi:hypothetical protein
MTCIADALDAKRKAPKPDAAEVLSETQLNDRVLLSLKTIMV